MKQWLKHLSVLIVAVVLVAAWLVYFHNEVVASHVPQWGWVQFTVTHLGQAKEVVVEPDEDPDNTKNEIPVHVGKVAVTTLHRYIEGYGIVAPRPQRPGQMAGSSGIASPVAGVVSKVSCQIGQTVRAGDVLITLDDRLVKSAEDQADAALEQAKASLAVLKATPRPDQLQIAQLAIDKAQGSVDFAQKTYERMVKLAADQGTTAKSVEQAAQDLAAARNDLLVAQKQLALLKTSPTPEELAAEQAKVRQADAALATAKAQRQMMAITAPIDGTVVELAVNPGEAIDTTKTLVQLVAMDRLMVDIDVPAEQLPATAEGLPAQVMQSSGKPETSGIAGKITFVSPQVEAKNGSVMVGIDLPAGAGLRPGLTVRVRIVAQEHKDCLAVPREAAFPNDNGDSTIAIVTGEQAVHRTVKTGLEENGLIEVISDGLKEGTTVVTSGAFGLQATQATHVKVVE